MATFPLLNLPPVISERVLQNLKFGDLFCLSQCSKRTFNQIKTHFSKSQSIIIMFVNISASSKYHLAVYGGSQVADWVFLHERDPKIMDLENPKPHKVAGCEPMDFCNGRHTQRSVEYSCVSRHSVKDILNFGKYLLTLFNASVRMMDIKPVQIKYLDDILSIDAFRKCQSLTVGSGILSHDDFRKVLGCFETEDTSLVCSTKRDFSLNQAVKLNRLSSICSSWVNFQTLQNLDLKSGGLYKCALTNEDLNKFLKTWLEGSNTKLEHIRISRDKREENKIILNLSKIVEGIPSTPGVAKRPDATGFRTYRNRIDYATGVDLRRESDGMLATVLVYKDRDWGEMFLFVVWHVPNPNLVVVG